jgi:hypothetical protein
MQNRARSLADWAIVVRASAASSTTIALAAVFWVVSASSPAAAPGAPFVRFEGERAFGHVYVGADRSRALDLTVTYSNSDRQLIFADPSGITAQQTAGNGPTCHAIDKQTASCDVPNSDTRRTGVELYRSKLSDRVRVVVPAATGINVGANLKEGADTFTGSAERDGVNGGPGDDRLSGGAGNDNFVGGLGDDSLSGGAGSDWLDGANGRDVLNGGGGRDYLLGAAIRFPPGDNPRGVVLPDEHVGDVVKCGSGSDRATTFQGDHVSGCEAHGRKVRVPWAGIRSQRIMRARGWSSFGP